MWCLPLQFPLMSPHVTSCWHSAARQKIYSSFAHPTKKIGIILSRAPRTAIVCVLAKHCVLCCCHTCPPKLAGFPGDPRVRNQRGGSRDPAIPFSLPLSQVTQYLLDQSFVMDEESLYESSLRLEPKLTT